MKQKKQLPSDFSELMKATRCNLSMTQQDLAAKVGASKTYISLVENGIKTPSVRLIKKICAVLDLSLPGYLSKNFLRSNAADDYSITKLPYSYFGRILLYHRAIRNLKLHDIARLCSISETEVLAIEENHIVPKLEMILHIINSTQIDIPNIVQSLHIEMDQD